MKPLCLTVALVSGLAALPAFAQLADDNLTEMVDAREIPVTIDNFTRAASDIEFDKYVALAGGINRFYHFRKPTPVDNQPTVRMNRDTLYSTAIVDITKGATLTLPEVGERYMTAMIYNQDHYVNKVFHGGGTYTLDTDTFDTDYVIVYMRTLVDADDPEDVAAVNAIQDQMQIEAAASNPFIPKDYDQDAYEALVERFAALLPFTGGIKGTFGTKERVIQIRHLIGTAVGWGGLPETEAMYPSNVPGLPVGEYKIEVPADVPVGAFWSVSLYNADGFFEKNAHDGYVVNSIMGERKEDGSMTVHFGGCDDGRVNCLPIMDGWNYVIRLYQPGEDVLDGSWTFPDVEPVN